VGWPAEHELGDREYQPRCGAESVPGDDAEAGGAADDDADLDLPSVDMTSFWEAAHRVPLADAPPTPSDCSQDTLDGGHPDTAPQQPPVCVGTPTLAATPSAAAPADRAASGSVPAPHADSHTFAAQPHPAPPRTTAHTAALTPGPTPVRHDRLASYAPTTHRTRRMLSHAAKQYVEQQVVAEATARGFRPATSWYHGDLWRSGLELGLWDTDTNPEGLRSHAKKILDRQSL
jgi:hypothetical protein